MACVEFSTTNVGQATVTTELVGLPVAETSQVFGAQLVVGEVCSVSSGTIVALAASDGPLRTRNGGYFLLNPATNPPQG
jgi:hypothetical protein